MAKSDPNKLIALLRKYLTPPDEEETGSRSSSRSEAVKTEDQPPEDIIYKNVEFRTILEDCISFFGEGKVIMDKLYDSIDSQQPQLL